MTLSSQMARIPRKLSKMARGLFIAWPSGPVLIYQMGKVGSKTVEVSLRAYAPHATIHHSHLLNDLDELERSIVAKRPNPGETAVEIAKGRQLRGLFERRTKPWHVVSLVRDPVARNISAFFQNLTEMFPPGTSIEDIAKMEVGELRELFLNQYAHDAPEAWFQRQLAPLTGIDVYAIPFDHSRARMVAEGDRCRLLVLRMEDLSVSGAGAISDFLGLEGFRLTNANEGDDKDYKTVYRKFVKQVRLPDEYLDRMYDTGFARHFYRPDEIAAFRGRWQRPARAGETS